MHHEELESIRADLLVTKAEGGIEPFEEGTRAPLRASVKLKFDSFGSMQSGFTANVSEGGMFVADMEVRPVGTLVKFELSLDVSSAPVAGLGEVVWIRLKQRNLGQPPGMGIQFRYLDVESSCRLEEALHRAIVETRAPKRSSKPQASASPRSNRLLRELEDALARSGKPGSRGR